ncbi:MAG: hypothetical protein ACRCYT_01190 [Cetobacterium sp.]
MNRLLTVGQVGCFGVNRQKGLFIEYNSYTHGLIQLEYLKASNDGKYYYLITNNNVSHYVRGTYHEDVMILYVKIEKLLDLILEGVSYEIYREKANKLFNFKKYENDTFDSRDLFDFIKENEKELKEYIDKIYPMF